MTQLRLPMLRLSMVQGDNRYCVVGFVKGDKDHRESVGWTNDKAMAETIKNAITHWPRYGAGEVLDFKRTVRVI